MPGNGDQGDRVLDREMFTSTFSESEVSNLLSTPEVSRRLDDCIGANGRVTLLQARTYQATGSRGEFIVRFPADEDHLSMLRKEAQIQAGLRNRISALTPDTSLIENLDGYPAFAIHRMIRGEPLTSECYANSSQEARDRLVQDLANFFHETHTIPLETAADWLGIPLDGERAVADLASAIGKPTWFSPDAVAEMRPTLESILNRAQMASFEDTIGLFQALGTNPHHLVFGHGDMHGYNMAIDEDDVGLKFIGAFDLGCAGILDIHEDFFRLSLISEDLLERVIGAYQDLSGRVRSISRDRIAIYYRAFLFYLMSEVTGEGLEHLKRLLGNHLECYSATYGPIVPVP